MKYKILIVVGDGDYGALACTTAEFDTREDAEIAIGILLKRGRTGHRCYRMYKEQ